MRSADSARRCGYCGDGCRVGFRHRSEPNTKITDAMLGDIKIDVVRHLASHAPSVLLDAVCAVPRVIDEAALPRDVALLIGLDASGYDTSPEGHRLSCFPRASMRGAFGRWARSAAN